MLYGTVAWDPILIVAQIVSLQCLFYLTLGLAQAIFLGPFLGHLSITYIFNWRTIEVHNTVGWMNVASNLATACLGAVYIMWLVERAKKCVDFASTVYLFHLLFVWIVSGFPASLVWWGTNGVSLLVMALLGEWLCVQRELQDIPIGTGRARGNATSAGGASTSSGAGQAARGASSSGSARDRSRGAVSETTPLLELVTTNTGSSSGTGSVMGSGLSGSGAAPRLAAAALGAAKQQPGQGVASPRGPAVRAAP